MRIPIIAFRGNYAFIDMGVEIYPPTVLDIAAFRNRAYSGNGLSSPPLCNRLIRRIRSLYPRVLFRPETGELVAKEKRETLIRLLISNP